jgi:hypothetical protein
MLYSSALGTGKSTLLRIIGAIYGPSNSAFVSEQVFSGRFTGYFAGKEVILMDEVNGLEEEAHTRLERLTTEDQIDLEKKGKDAITVQNYSTIYMTSNRSDALPLKPNDRRTVVAECKPKKRWMPDDPRWQAFNDWLDLDNGYGIVRWFLERLPVDDFNPRFMPPNTPAKQHMTSTSKSDYYAWAMQLSANVDDMLEELGVPKERQYFTAEELEYLRVGHLHGDKDKMTNYSRQLGRQGLGQFWRPVNGGAAIKLRDGKVRAIWPIRGKEEAPNKEVRENISRYPIPGFTVFEEQNREKY